ncbi:MAG: hypothetical protein V7K55_14560 [Nostoc sp.]|uniref:hypothetical protein n=1 Tax=Nostoc sp. TaxID=1180 RepID=UPI002FFB1827
MTDIEARSKDFSTYSLSTEVLTTNRQSIFDRPLVQTHYALVFERINTKIFEQCFRRWIESIVENTGAQIIPIDGKTLKGSKEVYGIFHFSVNCLIHANVNIGVNVD